MPDTEYRTIQGRLSSTVIKSITALYELIFNSPGDRVAKKLRREDLKTVVAEKDSLVVGFKIGYGYDEKPLRFYSWLGGVHPDYRRQGIGGELMRRQHEFCLRTGFQTIRTKTTNQWPSMLLLNIRHGFRVIGTYVDEEREIKIVLEKRLQ